MTECTLKDSTPTTTITFASFKEITDRYDEKYFNAIAITDNQPPIIIVLQAWIHYIKIKFQLMNDALWPASGESVSDKWANLVALIKTGGDSGGLFTLTFDREDSTPGTPVTESYDGSVKNLSKRVITGTHVAYIDGSFEFYEGELS